MDNILNTIKNTFLLNSTQFLFIVSVLILAFLCDLWLIRKEKNKNKINDYETVYPETGYTETELSVNNIEHPDFEEDYFNHYRTFKKCFHENPDYNICYYLDDYCLKIFYKVFKDKHSYILNLILTDGKYITLNFKDKYLLELLFDIYCELNLNCDLDSYVDRENYIDAKFKFLRFFVSVLNDEMEIHRYIQTTNKELNYSEEFLIDIEKIILPMFHQRIIKENHEILKNYIDEIRISLSYLPDFISESVNEGLNKHLNKTQNKSIEETEDIIYKGAEDIITDVFEKLKKNKI
ncbi:hypothetical protein ABRE86_004558 [Salmonella enterica]|nr:hypothetical protein [Salmonella enterica]